MQCPNVLLSKHDTSTTLHIGLIRHRSVRLFSLPSSILECIRSRASANLIPEFQLSCAQLPTSSMQRLHGWLDQLTLRRSRRREALSCRRNISQSVAPSCRLNLESKPAKHELRPVHGGSFLVLDRRADFLVVLLFVSAFQCQWSLPPAALR